LASDQDIGIEQQRVLAQEHLPLDVIFRSDIKAVSVHDGIESVFGNAAG
jgi:hypothetical protein